MKARFVVAVGLIAALTFGVTFSANAFWYNTATVASNSQTVKVTNVDKKTFKVAPRKTAWNVTRVYVEGGKCVKLKFDNFTTTTNCSSKARWVKVSPYSFRHLTIRKYNR